MLIPGLNAITLTHVILLQTALLWPLTQGYLDDLQQCEVIRIDMCSHLKYNMTRMPNFLGHTTQEEARRELAPYSQLVNFFNCSQHIKFFLCSLFVPMCTEQLDGPLVIEVCRSMCLQVKSDCEPKLASIQVPWPLNCSRLPESNSKEQLCMAPEILQTDPIDSISKTRWPPQTRVPPVTVSPVKPTGPTPADKDKLTDGSCGSSKYIKYDNSTCSDLCQPSCQSCIPKCENVLYTEKHKTFAYAFMAVLASLCIVSTVFTIVTFCIEPGRFRYPTRPVVFMAFCYLMYGTAYFIRIFIPSENIMCKPDSQGHLLQIVNGMESTLCILIFLMQYYFGTASHIWWLILTLTWYLAASRKWSLEALNSIACYFHLFAWAIPAVLTIAILVTGKVDSNELMGMCFVGNHDRWALLVYVIVPLALLLVVGEIFLLAGFAALLRIRTNLKTQEDGGNIRNLEKLMAKIGLFAILYTVPSVCVLGAHIHESFNIDIWRCMSSALSSDADLTHSIPTVEIQILKLCMSLLVGTMVCMWVLSAKTIKSCEKRCCKKQRAAPQLCHLTQHPSYMVAKSADGSSYNIHQHHYRFPSRHTLLSSYYTPSSIGIAQKPEPVNL